MFLIKSGFQAKTANSAEDAEEILNNEKTIHNSNSIWKNYKCYMREVEGFPNRR